MKSLILNFESAGHEFVVSKLDREDLYGKKDTVPELPDGTKAMSGYLAADGQTIASKRFNHCFSAIDGCHVDRSEAYVVDADGKKLDKRESMFDVPPKVFNATIEDLANYATHAVYMLDAAESDDELARRIVAGEVFMTEYAYKATYNPQPMMLVAGSDGAVYALVLKPLNPQPLGQNVIAMEIEDDADDEEEVDFAMM